jgi:WD40 repeat protein
VTSAISATGEQGRSRSYPEGNPFPPQGSITIDSAGALKVAGSTPTPTLLWGPVENLTRLMRQYLDAYRPSTRGTGFPVVLCGEHGAGKTHTVRHVMGLVASGELHPRPEVLSCFQIYARAEGTDFMELYRQLMKQVPLAVLRDMTLRFLGMVSSELFGEALKSDAARDRAAKIVQANPETVRRAFEHQLVEEDEAREQQAKEIRETFGKQENFHNVLTYLLRDDLATTARAWLVGEDVSTDDVKKLGVVAPIRTATAARWGLRFLASLFGRGGRPLVVYIDQYEKLVIDAERGLHTQNVGLLRSLVDEISKESGMMVLAGNEQAWQTLAAAPDLRQRFGKNVIAYPQLTLDQSKELVRLYLTLGRYEVVDVWALDKPMESLFILRGHALPIRSIALTPDGRRVISASKDSTIKVWDVERRVLTQTLLQHRDAVNAVAVSPDGKLLASASDDRTVRLWDIESGECLMTFEGHESWVNGVAFSPDGHWLVSASSDATIRIWNRSSGRCEGVLDGHTDTVWSVAVTPGSDRIVSGSSDGTVRVWSLPDGAPIATLLGHRSWVNAVVVSPDGRRAASASDDRTVRVWDLDKKVEVRVLAAHEDGARRVAWLADGTLLSGGIDDRYVLWNTETGETTANVHRPSGNVIAFAVRSGPPTMVFSGVGELRRESSVAQRQPPPGPEELYPFEEDAIRMILASGGGNVRRLIQDCAEVLGRALPRRQLITEDFVRRGFSPRTSEYLDRGDLIRRIEKLMAERALNFKRAYRVKNAAADLAVLAADGVPRMLVQVSEPLFHAQEAAKALSDVGLVHQARNLPASVIIVVAGYASPEVSALLRRAAHEVIVFDPERFDAEFGVLLDRLRDSLAKETPPQLSALKGDLDSVKAALQQLATVRNQETVNLETQLRHLLEAQSGVRHESHRDDIRGMWTVERRGLEERIRETRKAAKRAEFEELETLRRRADEELFWRVRWVAIVLVTAAVLAAGFGYLGFDRPFDSDFAVRRAVLMGGFVLGWATLFAVGAAALSPNIRARLRFRPLATALTSPEELDRLASKSIKPSRSGASRLIRHTNPHLRYAGAAAAAEDVSTKELVAAINAEPSRIIRRALALALGRRPNDLAEVLRDVRKRTLELGYTIEVVVREKPFPPALLAQLPGGLRALSVIAAKETPAPGAEVAQPSEAVVVPYRTWLSQAFNADLFSPPIAAGRISEQVLREALRDLSPFDEPGIGTLDHLECIDRVNQCFLFFNQIRFYQEHGAGAM